MNDLLENVLRDTLSRRAAHVDPQARRRLLAIDYRPRRRRIPILPAVGAVGLAGAAVALALIFTLGSTPAPAFAGWSPTPTQPRPGQISTALTACGGHPVLLDVRGPFTAAVYAKRGGVATCLLGPAFSSSSGASSEAPTVHPGQIQVFEQTASGPRGSATMLDGRVGAGVTGVRIELSTGRTVTATVSHGWYLVWWPGAPHGRLAEIVTARGTQTVRLPASDSVGSGGCGGPANSGCASVGPGATIGG